MAWKPIWTWIQAKSSSFIPFHPLSSSFFGQSSTLFKLQTYLFLSLNLEKLIILQGGTRTSLCFHRKGKKRIRASICVPSVDAINFRKFRDSKIFYPLWGRSGRFVKKSYSFFSFQCLAHFVIMLYFFYFLFFSWILF